MRLGGAVARVFLSLTILGCRGAACCALVALRYVGCMGTVCCVLRGPSSVLYGGSNPGGLLNAVSKKPLFTPFNYVEFGVNEFGRTYGAFDFSGPVPVGFSPVTSEPPV